MTDDAAVALLLVRRVPAARRPLAEALAGPDLPCAPGSHLRSAHGQWWEVVEAAADIGSAPLAVAFVCTSTSGTRAEICAVTVPERNIAGLLVAEVIAASRRDGVENMVACSSDRITVDALVLAGFAAAVTPRRKPCCSNVAQDGAAACWVLQL